MFDTYYGRFVVTRNQSAGDWYWRYSICYFTFSVPTGQQ